ncbi:Ig-like domain-containing protein [Muricauda sp. CAU 1633]|uniref:Ig-like domain-containing protein n=1 Tax=Allomuricauda sp. CAU 1633 TaxID=2816036 RepID=UPI001A8CF775|nr:Ig-like domain-containing protein [Muricauda sp. CAU 1633]MBO0323866.1 Ig-like domain-containing protein [Muricauda sp. CAU 1633]
MGNKLQLKRITWSELSLIFLLLFLGCSKDDDKGILDTAVQEIEIFTEESHLNIGGTVQLNTVVTPVNADNPDVFWGTDNPNVAIVDELGEVSGLKTGQVTIFAISKENLSISDSVVLEVE